MYQMIKTLFLKKKQTVTPRLSSQAEEAFARALQTFQETAQRVPAYADFLKKQNIDPSTIRTPEEFAAVPAMAKTNYLKKYSLPQLLWDGSFNDVSIVSTSSGSSGLPTYWPRGVLAAEESAHFHETIFNQNFQTKQKSTLVVIAFSMGNWIAGTYTLSAMQELQQCGHKITVITPGIDKGAIIRCLQDLAPCFEQTILMGYPPFIKDAIDGALDERVRLGPLNLKIVLAGETISERWRDYILKRIKAVDEYGSMATIYGTADAGLLGNETPLSIYIRRLAMKNQKLAETLFPNAMNLPSLVQYDPMRRYFEEEHGYLVFTARNVLPLIRYKILDKGRIIPHQEMIATLTALGHTIPTSVQCDGQQLPFLVIDGRTDVSTTFYALNVYPEHIKHGLELPQLQRYISGKFVVSTEYDDKTQEQSLHLMIELKKRVQSSVDLKQMILRSVVKSLKAYNNEYNRLYQELKHKADPIIELVDHESPEFAIKIKHRWVN